MIALAISAGDGVAWGQSLAVRLDHSGEGCVAQGWRWDLASRTCTMTGDLVRKQLVLADDGITLDCAGRRICWPLPGGDCSGPVNTSFGGDFPESRHGILAVGHSDIAIVGCEVIGFQDASLAIHGAGGADVTGIRVRGFRARGGSYHYNSDPLSNGRTKVPADGLNLKDVRASVFQDIEVSGWSDRAVHVTGNYRHNVMRNLWLHDGLDTGVAVFSDVSGGVAHDNLYDTLTHEWAVDRDLQGVAFTINDGTRSVLRRLRAYPKSGPGIRYFTGLSVRGDHITIVDSEFVDPQLVGISLASPATNVTVIGNRVLGGGGGIFLPRLGPALLLGNRFCTDFPAVFGAGMVMSDVVRIPPPAPALAAPVVGIGNTCRTTTACTFEPPATYTCTANPGTAAYRDLQTPGNPCTFTCPARPADGSPER